MSEFMRKNLDIVNENFETFVKNLTKDTKLNIGSIFSAQKAGEKDRQELAKGLYDDYKYILGRYNAENTVKNYMKWLHNTFEDLNLSDDDIIDIFKKSGLEDKIDQETNPQNVNESFSFFKYILKETKLDDNDLMKLSDTLATMVDNTDFPESTIEKFDMDDDFGDNKKEQKTDKNSLQIMKKFIINFSKMEKISYEKALALILAFRYDIIVFNGNSYEIDKRNLNNLKVNIKNNVVYQFLQKHFKEWEVVKDKSKINDLMHSLNDETERSKEIEVVENNDQLYITLVNQT